MLNHALKLWRAEFAQWRAKRAARHLSRHAAQTARARIVAKAREMREQMGLDALEILR